MLAEHLRNNAVRLVLMCHFFISILLSFNSTQAFLEYAQILHISASSQSANNQFLKTQVTRTPLV